MAVNPSIQLGTSGNWAIKEDNLLAYKQLGNKFFDREFDFSRGTRATFVGRNGLIQESGLTSAELVTNGDFSSDTAWVKENGSTISVGVGNVIANGGINSTAGNWSLNQVDIFAFNKTYKVSFKARQTSGTGNFQVGQAYQIGFNESITSAFVEYSFYITAIFFSGNGFKLSIGGATIGDTFEIDNVSVKEIQLDVPRIDFTDDPTGHLLLEPQSTNLETQSAALTTGWNLTTGATSQIETSITPFGVSGNVYKLTNATSNPPSWGASNTLKKQYSVNATDPASFYTFSVYVKSAGSTTINIQLRDNTNGQDLKTGLISLSSEWQRVTISKQLSTSTTLVGIVIAGTDGDILLADAQFEQQSYATSYIPTSGSAVTRNQELCNNSGTVNDFNSEEGVLYAEITALANDGTFRVLGFSDGTQNNRVFIGYSSVNNIICQFEISSSVVYNFNFTADITINSKLALKYKENDFALWVNGVEVNSQSSGNTFPIGTLTQMQFTSATLSSPFYGKTKNLKVFKRALTDTELQELTT